MLLYGNELAGYIKQQQLERVRSLQHLRQKPHLAIISNEEVVSDKYIQKKQEHGADIGVNVTVHQPSPREHVEIIRQYNEDASVHGIVVQLPLPGSNDTENVLSVIAPRKDVDGLHPETSYSTPAATAILWLLSNYDIALTDKTVGVIGQGHLVGKPLVRMLRQSGIEPLICDKTTENFEDVTARSDIIVTATGKPKFITSDYIRPGAVVIDAGTTYQDGVLTGDVDPAVYDREDVWVSPVPGGIGPLTICALFDNLLRAFQEQSA